MKILRQLQFAIQDFVEHIKWIGIICIGLSITMVSLSFCLNLLLGYEMQRIPALIEYNKNDLVKITMIDSHQSIQDEEKVVAYLLSFVESHSDTTMVSFQMTNTTLSENDKFIVGLGKFEDFYSINCERDGICLTMFGDKRQLSNPNLDITYVQKPLEYISTMGRVLVVLMHDTVITGSIEEIEKIRGTSFKASELLGNFIFVNEDQTEIDTFINELNSISPSVVVFADDLNMQLKENVFGQSFTQLIIFSLIMFLMLMGIYIGMLKIVGFINDKNIKSYTIHHLAGAHISELYFRALFLNLLIIIFASLGGAAVLCVIAGGNQLINYIVYQSIIYCVLFPIIPLLKMKRFKVYDNLRGDFDEREN